MKLLILAGVMIKGTPVFPTVKVGKEEVPTVVDVDKATAKILVLQRQAKRAEATAKVNFEIKDPELAAEADALDAFFGDDDDDDAGSAS